MRRKNKQITDSSEMLDILASNRICRLGLSEGGQPHIFPMNYGYHDNKIYLHSALAGKKMDIIKANNRVCFEISDSIELANSQTACNFGTRYRSIIGFGTIHQVIEPAQKDAALKLIMKQQTGVHAWDIPEDALNKVAILKIEIDTLTAKKSGL
jgi:hypothetical protein